MPDISDQLSHLLKFDGARLELLEIGGVSSVTAEGETSRNQFLQVVISDFFCQHCCLSEFSVIDRSLSILTEIFKIKIVLNSQQIPVDHQDRLIKFSSVTEVLKD